jgi:hypothetical protein
MVYELIIILQFLTITGLIILQHKERMDFSDRLMAKNIQEYKDNKNEPQEDDPEPQEEMIPIEEAYEEIVDDGDRQ